MQAQTHRRSSLFLNVPQYLHKKFYSVVSWPRVAWRQWKWKIYGSLNSLRNLENHSKINTQKFLLRQLYDAIWTDIFFHLWTNRNNFFVTGMWRNHSWRLILNSSTVVVYNILAPDRIDYIEQKCEPNEKTLKREATRLHHLLWITWTYSRPVPKLLQSTIYVRGPSKNGEREKNPSVFERRPIKNHSWLNNWRSSEAAHKLANAPLGLGTVSSNGTN